MLFNGMSGKSLRMCILTVVSRPATDIAQIAPSLDSFGGSHVLVYHPPAQLAQLKTASALSGAHESSEAFSDHGTPVSSHLCVFNSITCKSRQGLVSLVAGAHTAPDPSDILQLLHMAHRHSMPQLTPAMGLADRL